MLLPPTPVNRKSSSREAVERVPEVDLLDTVSSRRPCGGPEVGLLDGNLLEEKKAGCFFLVS